MNKKTATKLSNDIKKTIDLLNKIFKIKLVRFLIIILLLIIFLPFIIFFFIRPKPAEYINYGFTFSNKYAQQMQMDWKNTYETILNEIEFENIRIVAYWDQSEPENNLYNFDDVKWQIEKAKEKDINVIMTLGYKVPRYPECFEPEWVKDYSQQEREKELIEYVRQGVIELKDYDNIVMWQIENEPFWPFGDCKEINRETVVKEINTARMLDNRPIIVQDSGEGGFWFATHSLGDKLGISMYRKIWYDFWGILFGRSIYFQYPLAHWTYKVKADIVGIDYNNIMVTELQAEPWGPGLNSDLPNQEIDNSMSHQFFIDTINYAQKSGFKDLYLWGPEWWLYMRDIRGDSFYWDTAKSIINNQR